MKQKLSISIDQKLVNVIENMLHDCRFRNKSHVIEVALNKLIEDKK